MTLLTTNTCHSCVRQSQSLLATSALSCVRQSQSLLAISALSCVRQSQNSPATSALFHIKLAYRIFCTQFINNSGKTIKAGRALVVLLFSLPLITACSTPAYINAKQDDVLTQIDVWSLENEYGKAFTTLKYVSSSHPQYHKLQLRKKTLIIQAQEYEQRIDKKIRTYIKNNQWSQALQLLQQAKKKYPVMTNNRKIATTESYLINQQQKQLSKLEAKMQLLRAQWIISARPVYQQRLNTDPHNAALKKQFDSLTKEADFLSRKLIQLAEKAIDKNHYQTAKLRISQAIALKPGIKDQEFLAQLQSRIKKADKKKQQVQSRTRKAQHKILLEDIEQSLVAGDLLKARQLLAELDDDNEHEAIELELQLEQSIKETVIQLLSEANSKYTDGQFHQAIELWQQVLLYEPLNSIAIQNIQRAEKVINKLTDLREKQQH